MRVNEIFYSIQGEGHHTGTPAVFVRFSGCNRNCPFCDTNHANAWRDMTEDEIVAEALSYPAKTVIMTGGEPSMQLTVSLVDKLHAAGKKVHVETNGTLPLPTEVDWVTCSPKGGPYGIRHIDEIKIVYLPGSDPLMTAGPLPIPKYFYLQPLAQPDGSTNAAETVEYIKAHPQWRLSLQTHKLIDIP